MLYNIKIPFRALIFIVIILSTYQNFTKVLKTMCTILPWVSHAHNALTVTASEASLYR
jgi:hypothetical protein